jgi:hypothetical protein
MKIRAYEPRDLEALKAIHAKRGLPGACMPDPSNPLFFVQRVIEKEGQPAAAAFVKLTCEPYLLLDPDRSTRENIEILDVLSGTTEAAVRKHGIEDISVWVPVEAGPTFGHALEAIGFTKSPWQSYSRILK